MSVRVEITRVRKDGRTFSAVLCGLSCNLCDARSDLEPIAGDGDVFGQRRIEKKLIDGSGWSRAYRKLDVGTIAGHACPQCTLAETSRKLELAVDLALASEGTQAEVFNKGALVRELEATKRVLFARKGS